MKTNKVISTLISFSILFSSAQGFAQSFTTGDLAAELRRAEQKLITQQDAIKSRRPEIHEKVVNPVLKTLTFHPPSASPVKTKRQPWQTITSWAEKISNVPKEYFWDENGYGLMFVDADAIENTRMGELISILSDRAYMNSLNIYEAESCSQGYTGNLQCEIKVLNALLPHIQISAAEEKVLVDFITKELLAEYNPDSSEFRLRRNYAFVAVSLLGNKYTQNAMLSNMMQILRNEPNPARQVWTSFAIAHTVKLSDKNTRILRQNLEAQIQRLSNELKDARRGGLPNNYVVTKIFGYTVSFFAYNENAEGLWQNAKHMISSGALAGKPAYLMDDMPGTRGGKFTLDAQGHKHHIALNLIAALYKTFDFEGDYQAMNDFIIKYGKVNKETNDFENYLMFAIIGLETTMSYNDNQTLEGWGEQYEVFTWVLTKALWKTHWYVGVLTHVQGAAEVATEWITFGKVLQAAGKGIKMIPWKWTAALRGHASSIAAGTKYLWADPAIRTTVKVGAAAAIYPMGEKIVKNEVKRYKRPVNITMKIEDVEAAMIK